MADVTLGGRRRLAAVGSSLSLLKWGLGLLPALALLCLAIFYPMVRVTVSSFGAPSWTFGAYEAFLASPAYVDIFVRTFETAAIVTVVCLLLAYPYAYLMARSTGTRRAILFMGVLVPLFTSAVVRTFAWFILLAPTGPLISRGNAVNLGSWVGDGTLGAVVVGMVQVLTPLAVLPLYATMVSIPTMQLKAAASLGASPARVFRRVFLPQTRTGLVGAGVLVFTAALGFYLVPQLLGSPQQELLPQLLYDEVMNLLNYRLGDAAACLSTAAAVVVVLIAFWGGAGRVAATGGVETVTMGVEQSNPSGERHGGRGLAAACGVVGAFLIVPSLVAIPLSFAGQASFVFPPTSWSVRWYVNLFTNAQWQGALVTSAEVAIASALLATTVGCAAAFALVRSKSAVARRIQGLVLVPQIVPAVVLAVAVYIVFLDWGITGTVLGFVLAHAALGTPLVVIVAVSGFSRFEERLDQAAAALGAGPVRRAIRVWVPLLAPTVVAAFLLAAVTSLDEFMVAFFIQGPGVVTLPVQMFSSIQDEIDPTVAAAGSVMLVLAAVVVGAVVMLTGRSRRG